ncbi:MAG TPA: alginate export family protein [Candidatus Limnocylindria bacterium]|nr:alginate export family protein [Candidatus Limnocylindria bacterium]
MDSRALLAALVCSVAVALPARAEDGRGSTDHLTLLLSDRMRGEFVDWFDPPPGVAPAGAERYAFFANQLRAGARLAFPHVALTLELQHTELANLPEDASLPPPQGNLGTGATYFANTRRSPQGELFLKQGNLTLQGGAFTATLGRFDYRDGLETVPADPALAYLKRSRIAERLVGPFDFTHVTRSFDGGRVAWDHAAWNVTAWGARPTQGGYEVSANVEVGDVWLSGIAATLARLGDWAPPVDARVFYLFYHDGRHDVLKADNRPLAVRAADREPISVHTGGMHALGRLAAGPGAIDVLLWGALQAGHWGEQDHAAWAYAVEAGYQLSDAPAAPWLRLGWNQSSGDEEPEDDKHRTFFQPIPTPRIYAQTPFYTLMNTSDFFVELVLRPHERLFVRADWHWLRVTQGEDLWYQGGGVTKESLFGYAGAPANGRHGLGQLVDVSFTLTLHPRLTLGTYFGHVFGGAVIGESFAGTDANYGYAELTFRY